MTAAELEAFILEKVPTATVKAYDLTGGGDHWQLSIEAEEFDGLSLVEQHQYVYRILGDLMKTTIHALSLNTRVKLYK